MRGPFPFARLLAGMTLLSLAATLAFPLFEIGDTAVVGRVYAWGVSGAWDGVAASPGRLVNRLEALQLLLVAGALAASLGCLALRRPPRWLPPAMAALATLVPVVTWAQARTLAPTPADVLPILNGGFALLVGAVMFAAGSAYAQALQGSSPR